MTSTGLSREDQFDLEISYDVLNEVHFDGERHCSPEAPCRDAAYHVERVERITRQPYTLGATVESATQYDGERIVGRPLAGARGANQFGAYTVHPATERQVRFLERLLDERDLDAVVGLQSIHIDAAKEQVTKGTVSKKVASTAIEILLRLPVRTTPVAVPMSLASEKQVSFITRLLSERDLTGTAYSRWTPEVIAQVSAKEASAAITALLALPKTQAATAVLEAGIYRTDSGDIFKVYKAVHGSGKMLAKRLIVENGAGRFEYEGLATRFVKAEQRMTLEQAKEFGAIYGVCCNCGATLTDEKSIAAGIGPVCATRF